jgi:hypothetical protein
VSSPSAAEIQERAAAVLGDGGYQTTLPQAPELHPLELPLGPLELLLRLLLWTALAVAVGLAVLWLVRRLAPGAEDAAVPDDAPQAPIALPIASAEALAAQGRWGEAIHALLLDTLEALSRAARLAPSLTSREIVERVPLPAAARDALGGLVLAVELSRFGGLAAGEDDYRACLGRFHAFLDTYRKAA